ncbi:MAG: FtsX-like permease family protein [Lentisphaerae bacterium]|nr:FtsX-like permease family protein [Lentisphaerota bacterium]
METIGTQVKLPFQRALQIAVQGIRIRLGRSLVTISGVALGIAFLMSNLTAQFIKDALGKEREVRQTVNLMETIVRGEIGNFEGKNLSVAVFGSLGAAERSLLERLVAAEPAIIKAYGLNAPGLQSAALPGIGRDSQVLLVLGSARQCPVALAELAEGLQQKVVIDSVADRKFPAVAKAMALAELGQAGRPGVPAVQVRREVFFGKAADEQLVKLGRADEQERFRTIWIVIISILVTVIGVSNALLMSVTERFREIGTMKCLGALSSFIRKLFLIESALIGFCGSVLGMLAGALLPIVVFGISFDFRSVLLQMNFALLLTAAAGAVAAGTLFAIGAAIYPANIAARMVPATALGTNI